MKNVSIRTKITAVVAFLSLLLAAGGILGITSLKMTNATMKSIYDDRLVALGQLDGVIRGMNVNQLLVSRTLATPSTGHARDMDQVERNLDHINKEWSAYMATYLTPEEKRLAEQTAAAQQSFLEKGLRPAMEAIRAGNMTLAAELINGPMSSSFQPVREGVNQLIKLQLDVAQRDYEKSLSWYNWVLAASTSGIVAALMLSALAGWWLVRSICTPLAEAVHFAAGVAKGDLTQEIEVHANDEAGQLTRALKDMNQSLAAIVGQVRTGADSIATASRQIASGNADLSSRTEQQASALEETASVMEELTSTVKQNAENARQAKQLATSASSTAAQGGEVVSDVVNTMSDINHSAQQMADIISVIDGIAFQTNILALNAAVEAARAGEQGRGFAVVATEVRNLAQRSATAAKEIKQLISASVEKVEAGTRLVDRAGLTMGEVVESIKGVADIMAEISAASEEQSAGIEEVNKAIAQMDQVTQQNAALVEEAAAAAESMTEQAAQLAQAAGVFKLGRQTSSHPAISIAAKASAKVSALSATKSKTLSTRATGRKQLASASQDWEEF